MDKEEEIKMSIAINRSTKEMIGYWIPEGKTVGIIVTAYAVDDLEKKFDEALTQHKADYLKIQKN